MAPKITSGNFYTRWFQPTESTYLHKGEILVVFLIGYFIALSLWLLVNLGRDYNLSMELPLRFTGQADNMVFAEEPPESARIGVSGEGWKLLSLYRNPPVIYVSSEDGSVNISALIQEQMTFYPDLTLQEVQPSSVSVEMVPKISKRVPVAPDLDVRLKSQFEILGDVRVQPDSVTVTGAVTIVDTLQNWPTEHLQLRNVQDKVDQKLKLAESSLNLGLDTAEVQISFDVTEFTEGEIRIYVKAENVPDSMNIRFNPSVISVIYDVPIEFFSDAQDIVPYEAIVDYSVIVQDTTGSVVPTVRATTDEELNLRLRSFQPRRISYFRVIGDEDDR